MAAAFASQPTRAAVLDGGLLLARTAIQNKVC
jgi:hypothetical protein